VAYKETRKKYPVTLPPESRETSEKVRFGMYEDKQRKAILARHKQSKLNESTDAKEKRFLVAGDYVDRYDCMEYLVAMVSEGSRLSDLCKEDEMPTLREVAHWRKWHAEFEREMKLAESCRGLRSGERAEKLAEDATNDDNAAIVKLKYEALSKTAARLNADFQEKKIIQTEDITNKMSYEQIAEEIKALTKQFPALKTFTDFTEAEVVEGDEE